MGGFVKVYLMTGELEKYINGEVAYAEFTPSTIYTTLETLLPLDDILNFGRSRLRAQKQKNKTSGPNVRKPNDPITL